MVLIEPLKRGESLDDLFDKYEYSEDVLQLLATNLQDQDVLYVFQQVIRFRESGGFKKTYLSDWINKRRRYDNAFLILEATKFIRRIEKGASTPYYPTCRGNQLTLYLINELHLDSKLFKRLTEAEYDELISQQKIQSQDSKTKGENNNVEA